MDVQTVNDANDYSKRLICRIKLNAIPRSPRVVLIKVACILSGTYLR